MTSSTTRTVAFAPLMVGTAGDGHDEARREMASQWLMREVMPAWLRLANLDDLAVQAETAAGLTGDELTEALRAIRRLTWQARDEKWAAFRQDVERRLKEKLGVAGAAGAAGVAGVAWVAWAAEVAGAAGAAGAAVVEVRTARPTAAEVTATRAAGSSTGAAWATATEVTATTGRPTGPTGTAVAAGTAGTAPWSASTRGRHATASASAWCRIREARTGSHQSHAHAACESNSRDSFLEVHRFLTPSPGAFSRFVPRTRR
jgi:hypothetical protein